MNDREKQFYAELKSLLQKYDVEISANDEYQGYPECGEDIRIVAYSPSKFEGFEMVHDMIDIDFGRVIDKN